jgi:hypothetical protein
MKIVEVIKGFRKSARSNSQGGECVEVAALAVERDSRTS